MAPRLLDQGIRLVQAGGQRFFHQDRASPRQGPKPHLGVGRRRHGDRDGLDVGQQRVEVAVKAGSAAVGHGAAPGRVGIVDPDQTGVRRCSQVPGMVPPQRADADHADRKCRHRQTGTPRCELDTNSRKLSTSASGGSSVRARSMAWDRLSSELKKRR